MKITSATVSHPAAATPRKPSHQEMFWQMVQEDIGYVRAGYSMDLPGTFPPSKPGTVPCGEGESFSGKEILLARDIARMMSGGPQCQPYHFHHRRRNLREEVVAAYTIDISIVTARFRAMA
jgi:hypothetical protein